MKKLSLLAVIVSVVLIYSCNDDSDSGNGDDNNNLNIVEITSNIDKNTTWYADSIYVIKAYDFWVTATLTIQPGTIIKFTPDGAFMSVSSLGTVIANGTSTDSIIFTSIKDDAYGGDVNKDGNATSPAAKNWGTLLLEGNGSSFKHCKFLYGGKSSDNSTLIVYDVTASITNCTFAFNYGGKSGDFFYGALDATNAKPSTIIKNNVFYNNNIPLSVESVINIDNSNVFHNPEEASEKNTMNGIFIYSNDDFFQAVSWEETEVPFVISDGDLWIESSGSLTLANNVVVKFTPESTLLIQTGGVLNQNATNAFTSFKDDTRLGDTNGDAGATTPSNGDWKGIYDDSGSIPNPYFYTWPNIYYDSY